MDKQESLLLQIADDSPFAWVQVEHYTFEGRIRDKLLELRVVPRGVEGRLEREVEGALTRGVDMVTLRDLSVVWIAD